LIVDNLEALITELGGTPNNTSSTQLAALFSAAKLMERIKTVDGEQSGLDAGKLAGHPGSYYAPVNSPTLTGTPRAPTAEPEMNNTQIATTAFVQGVMNDGIKSVSKGFMSIWLTNMNNSSAPQIAAGSQVEVGGKVYTFSTNKTVSGTPANNAVNYLYAVVDDGTVNFNYATTPPSWNASKGGWYNGNNRAVARLFSTSSQYNGKVIIDSYNAINAVNTTQAIPTTDGYQISTAASINTETTITLSPGAYRISIKGGKGGNGGGSTEDSTGEITGTGGAGAVGQEILYCFC
jgi:hypothetical protein